MRQMTEAKEEATMEFESLKVDSFSARQSPSTEMELPCLDYPVHRCKHDRYSDQLTHHGMPCHWRLQACIFYHNAGPTNNNPQRWWRWPPPQPRVYHGYTRVLPGYSQVFTRGFLGSQPLARTQPGQTLLWWWWWWHLLPAPRCLCWQTTSWHPTLGSSFSRFPRPLDIYIAH